MTQKDRVLLFAGLLAVAAVLVFALISIFETGPEPSSAPAPSPVAAAPAGVAPSGKGDEPAGAQRETLRPDRTAIDDYVVSPPVDRPPPEGPVGSIRGSVVAPGGAPVEGAEIEVLRGSMILIDVPGAHEELGISSTSGSDGTFEIADVAPSDKYLLRASHPDYAPGSTGAFEVRAGEVTQLTSMVLKPALRVYGTVRTKAGQPLPNAMVSVYDRTVFLGKPQEEKPPWKSVLTDAQGFYEFRGTTFKNFSVSASAEGFGTQTRMNTLILETALQREINFELGPAFSLSGWVKTEDGSPLEGTKVTGSLMRSEYTSEATAMTDAAGRFDLANLEEGSYILSAEKQGYTPDRKANIAAGTVDATLTLRPQGTIKGFVVAVDTAKPVTSFSVTVKRHREGQPPANTGITSKVDSESGAFSLGGLEPDIYKVFVAAAQYAVGESEPIQVARGAAVEDVRVILDKGGTIEGRVIGPNGNPVARAEIRLNDNNYISNPIMDMFSNMIKDIARPRRGARTSDDGSFKLLLLSADTYQVAVSHPDFADKEMNDIVVARGQTTKIGDIVLSAGGTIKGYAYDESGSPLAGATVTASSMEKGLEGIQKSGLADASGSFVIKSVRPGKYQVTIQDWPDKGTELTHELLKMALAVKSKKTVDVVDGQTVTVDLRLERRTGG
ncbi:MAG: carboxypeptidase-like regulatory domain-containing protein [Planctomycetota bacterium]